MNWKIEKSDRRFKISMSSSSQSILSTIIHHPTSHLTVTALAASLLTAVSIYAYQSSQRNSRTRALKEELSSLPPPAVASTHSITGHPILPTKYDESLIKEQLARNIAFIGEEGIDKLRKSFVIIVGAGGVGSWAAIMLLRSGLEKIRLIDFDQVTLSSLNRHSVATHADVGTPKVVCLQKHAKNIVPWAKVEAVVDLFEEENAERLLSGNPDFIIDAIDNIDTKLHLLKYCYDKKLPIVSSMGAGAKADPSRIQISDISETKEDPLARAVRRRLHKLGIGSGITVVYSTEKPNIKLLPLDETRVETADEYATLPDFRSRILPVLGTIPAMFGMTIATHTITSITGYEIEPLPNKHRDALYARLHRELIVREKKLFGNDAVSSAIDKLTLIRWDRNQPLSPQNCVVMTKKEAAAHEKISASPEEVYDKRVVDLVKKRFREEERISAFR
ncbi:2796_t:CDS:2 [Paraglomus occultum]|uniref:2796_t:CDS:1 n=1 Tax=Paraglomus occultum TaxID=144539 RepID=A0A9N8WDS3_9GLOM|nr:2796_t:CDS:2 [Paraglomus occultum]